MRIRSGVRLSVVPILFCAAPTHAQTIELGPSGSDAEVRRVTLTDKDAFLVGEPLYRVGPGPGDYAFSKIVSGTLLPDGSAVVGDQMNREVVFLDADGAIEAVVGGEGQGPGEFRSIVGVLAIPPDTVVVEDDSNGTFTRYHGTRLLETESFSSGAFAWALEVMSWSSEAALLRTYSFRSGFTEPWLRGSVARYSRHFESLDTIAYYDKARRFAPGPLNPLRPSGRVAASGDLVAAVRQDLPAVDILDVVGESVIRVEWDEKPPRVTDDLWLEVREWSDSRGLPAERVGTEARRAANSEPVPVVGDVLVDRLGRVWVSRYTPDPRRNRHYRVFDASGRWLGWVRLPDRVQILDIGEDRILAIVRDELDVESVAVFPFAPAGP